MRREDWFAPVHVNGRPYSYIFVLVLGAIGYFALARLGLAFASLQDSASPIWPASGFAAALLIITGKRLWPAIIIAAFAANALTGGPISAIFISVGNAAEALLACWIIQRIGALSGDHFPIARTAGYASAALFASVASAGTGVATLFAMGALGAADTGLVAITWWAGDMMGILLFAPLICAIVERLSPDANAIPAPDRDRRWRMGLLFCLAVAIGPVVTIPAFLDTHFEPAIFLAFLWLVLVVRAFGMPGATTMSVLVAIPWLIATGGGFGPFAVVDINPGLINMQIVLAALVVSGLVLSELRSNASTAAIAVYCIGCLIGTGIFLGISANQRTVDQRHLDNLIANSHERIVERMNIYSNALNGGVALYAASQRVERSEWQRYVTSLDLVGRFPGINGLGVILPTDNAGAGAFVDAQRRDGAPDFAIRPIPGIPADLAAHPEKFVIVYSEPSALNLPAIGLDVASEPLRRKAAILARDTGQMAMTARITLVQDQAGTPGFQVYQPIYRDTVDPADAQSLRSSFYGWVYAAFIAKSFFDNAKFEGNEEVRVQIFDGPRAEPATLIYDSADVDHFHTDKESHLFLFGHELTLRWEISPGFDAQNPLLPALFSAGLILFSTLLAAFIAALMSQRHRAIRIAEQMNADLMASNERFELAAACTQDGLFDRDLRRGVDWISPRYTAMLGYDQEDAKDLEAFWLQTILPEDVAPARAQYQELLSGARDTIDLRQRYRHKDGSLINIHTRVMAIRNTDGTVERMIGVHTDITPLIRLEQQFRSAIDAMSDGFALFDSNDRVLLYNDAFLDPATKKMIGDPTGHTFEETLRTFAYHDMPVTDPDFDREAWIRSRIQRHNNPPDEPLELDWSGGRRIRVSERRTSDGGYVGIWTDVTEIKRLGQRLEDAISALTDGFALFDADDRVVICNDSFRSSSQLHHHDTVVGKTMESILREFAHAEITDVDARADPEAWVARRLARHRDPTDEAYEQVLTDGRILHIVERRTRDGGIVGVWSDVTALATAERRLEDAIESINEGFLLVDSEGRFAAFNTQYLDLYPMTAPYVAVGVPMADAMRQAARSGQYQGVQTAEEIEEFVTFWMDTYADPRPLTTTAQLADGRWRMISHHGTSDGGFVNVYSDITESKHREAEIAAANQRLEEQARSLLTLTDDLRNARAAAESASRSKSQFLANMSHELRTPLNGILGFAQIIKDEVFGKIEPERYRNYAEDIHGGGQYLLTLINDLLDLSKIEADKMTLNIDAIETTSVVGHAMKTIAGLAAERGIDLAPPDIADCPVMHVDETQARQILLNLLSNAVKFTPDAGRVSLRIVENGESGVVLTVTDTGIGMTQEEVAKSMERFGQTSTAYTKTISGTGLGLPLVEGLVKLHGGSMTIESEKGHGTTVIVRLPWHKGLYRQSRTE